MGGGLMIGALEFVRDFWPEEEDEIEFEFRRVGYVTADEWDDEMNDAAVELCLDAVTTEDDHSIEYFDEFELAEFERASIEYEQQLPTWAECFGFVDGFKCATFQF